MLGRDFNAVEFKQDRDALVELIRAGLSNLQEKHQVNLQMTVSEIVEEKMTGKITCIYGIELRALL